MRHDRPTLIPGERLSNDPNLGRLAWNETLYSVRKLRRKESHNPDCIKRDNIVQALVKKHEDGTFTLQEYFDAVVKANQDYDLPGAEQAALVNQGDSDSETEDEEL